MVLRLFFCLVILAFVNEGHSDCTEPPETGRGPRHYFFNQTSGICQPFYSGGLQVNRNNYLTKKDCTRACVCSLPRESGICLAYFPRFFFNKTSKACEMFIYGGCGGNANNFETLEDCQQACVSVCDLPSETGPCKAAMKRYFYNTRAKVCQLFTYGGCGGNANNFLTLAACQRACHP